MSYFAEQYIKKEAYFILHRTVYKEGSLFHISRNSILRRQIISYFTEQYIKKTAYFILHRTVY